MQKNLEQLQDFEEKQPYEIQTQTRLKVKIKRLNVRYSCLTLAWIARIYCSGHRPMEVGRWK